MGSISHFGSLTGNLLWLYTYDKRDCRRNTFIRFIRILRKHSMSDSPAAVMSRAIKNIKTCVQVTAVCHTHTVPKQNHINNTELQIYCLLGVYRVPPLPPPPKRTCFLLLWTTEMCLCVCVFSFKYTYTLLKDASCHCGNDLVRTWV